MRFFLVLLCASLALYSSAQKKGVIYYSNVDSSLEYKKSFLKIGLDVNLAPRKIELSNFPKLQNVIYDFISFSEMWYPQVDSYFFLDDESFAKKKKNNMKIQDLIYIQSKNDSYKWDGKKYFETPHVSSKIFFTTMIHEYSDKYVLEIKIAEQMLK